MPAEVYNTFLLYVILSLNVSLQNRNNCYMIDNSSQYFLKIFNFWVILHPTWVWTYNLDTESQAPPSEPARSPPPSVFDRILQNMFCHSSFSYFLLFDIFILLWIASAIPENGRAQRLISFKNGKNLTLETNSLSFLNYIFCHITLDTCIWPQSTDWVQETIKLC